MMNLSATPPTLAGGTARGATPFPRPRDWWLLAAALAILFLAGLGSRGLNNPDEGRYASIAQAMDRPDGNWWEPRQGGFGHYDKPPLIYWATALSFRLFGANEWAARAPSLLGAALSLASLGWAGWRLHNASTAWWAVLIAGTSLQFWVLGRVLLPDTLMAGWCTFAIAAWAECRQRNGAWGWWVVMLAGWVLAWWTKATPSLVPLAGLFVGTWMTGDGAGRRALRPWLLVPAIVALGSPWYLSMLRRYPDLSRFFFKRELLHRVTGRVAGRYGPFYYYVPLSLGAWLPWWPVTAWKLRRHRVPAAGWIQALGTEGWIVLVGLVVFSLINSKLPTYTLPLAPWAALLFARSWAADPDPRPSLARIMPGAVFAAVALALVIWPSGKIEANLGPNSSLRPVCRYLRLQGVRAVDCDHYWPDMEFYLADVDVRYVVRITNHLRERPSDRGTAPVRYIEPEDWLSEQAQTGSAESAAGGRWLVHYRRQQESPFAALPSVAAGRKTATVGEFDLYHLEPGSPLP